MLGDCVEELAVALTVCEVTAPSPGETPTTRRAMKITAERRGDHLSAFRAPRAPLGFINARFYSKSRSGGRQTAS
jgi:hypothetical protein